MVQTARNLLHLADIEQKKLGKRLECFTGFIGHFLSERYPPPSGSEPGDADAAEPASLKV